MKTITEKHNVGPCEVTAIYEYRPPQPSTQSAFAGAGVDVLISIPFEALRDHFSDGTISVFGMTLNTNWGKYDSENGSGYRYAVSRDTYRPTLLEALEHLRAEVAKSVAAMRDVYARRCAERAHSEAVNPFADDADAEDAGSCPQVGMTVVDTTTGQRHPITGVTISGGKPVAYDVRECAGPAKAYPVSAWGRLHVPADKQVSS